MTGEGYSVKTVQKVTEPLPAKQCISALWSEAKALQRSLPDNQLVMVGTPATQIKYPQGNSKGNLEGSANFDRLG